MRLTSFKNNTFQPTSDLTKIKRSFYSCRRFHRLACGALYTLLVLTGLFLLVALVYSDSGTFAGVFLCLVILSCVLFPTAVVIWSIGRVQKSRLCICIGKLSSSGQVAAIGVLLDARETRDKTIHTLAEGGLINLLPLMEEGDAGLLTWRQAYLLCRTLCSSKPAIVLATLAALTEIGSSEDLWDVSSLLGHTGGYFPPLANNAEVRDAAAICYEAIRARMEADRVRTTLLRPSMESSTEMELLRPVNGVAVSTPERLLRPASQDRYS
jgi:hypothetical protein